MSENNREKWITDDKKRVRAIIKYGEGVAVVSVFRLSDGLRHGAAPISQYETASRGASSSARREMAKLERDQ